MAEAGKNSAAVFPGKLAELVWQSAPAIQKSSWQLCRVMKAAFGALDDLRSKSGGVFRSEDGGETWTRMSA